jgi:hypothetical protein
LSSSSPWLSPLFLTTPQNGLPTERGLDKLRSALKLSGFVDVDVTEAGDKLMVRRLKALSIDSLLFSVALVYQSDQFNHPRPLPHPLVIWKEAVVRNRGGPAAEAELCQEGQACACARAKGGAGGRRLDPVGRRL